MTHAARNPLTRVAIWLGGLPWLPRILPQITAVDRWLQRVTRGRLSFVGLAGLTSLLLTVPGRRSGVPRSAPMLGLPWKGGYLAAGSNFGKPAMPAWVHNVRAVETARLTVRGRELTVVPHELSGAERDEAWGHMVEVWPNYATYAERTDRLIPVFWFEPV